MLRGTGRRSRRGDPFFLSFPPSFFLSFPGFLGRNTNCCSQEYWGGGVSPLPRLPSSASCDTLKTDQLCKLPWVALPALPWIQRGGGGHPTATEAPRKRTAVPESSRPDRCGKPEGTTGLFRMCPTCVCKAVLAARNPEQALLLLLFQLLFPASPLPSPSPNQNQAVLRPN